MPKIEPSFAVRAQLEAMLASGATRSLYFEQMRVYRQQFGEAFTETSWKVTSNPSEQLPRHIFIAFASIERDNNETQNNQVFDNGGLKRLSVRVNSRQYPEKELITNFTTAERNYTRAYMMFQEAMHKYSDTDSGSQLSVEDFASLYPIFHIDVSKHEDHLKLGHVDIEVMWTLSDKFKNLAGTGNTAYHVFCVILSDRYTTLETVSGKMNIII